MIAQCNKIRQVAGTLLHRTPHGVHSSFDYESIQHYLEGFIEILNKLERLGPGLIDPSSPMSTQDGGWTQVEPGLTPEEIEERELVQWASLKEYQEKFARENGFMRTL